MLAAPRSEQFVRAVVGAFSRIAENDGGFHDNAAFRVLFSIAGGNYSRVVREEASDLVASVVRNHSAYVQQILRITR